MRWSAIWLRTFREASGELVPNSVTQVTAATADQGETAVKNGLGRYSDPLPRRRRRAKREEEVGETLMSSRGFG